MSEIGGEKIIRKKIGLKFEGTARKSMITGLGKRADRKIYSILKPEYAAVRKKWR